MSYLSIGNVKITGISACVPKEVEEVNDFALFSVDDAINFSKTTGVERRRKSPVDVCSSDLCFKAAEKLIEELDWDRNEIDCLVFVSQTPDYKLPATSVVLQDRLSLSTNCYTLDISSGCSGWVYGLSVISSILSHGSIKKGLLLTGDTPLKMCSQTDKSTYPLFGDAGAATALEYSVENVDPLLFSFNSDGSGYDAIIIKDGGFRNPISVNSFVKEVISEGIERSKIDVVLEGMDVFSFGISKAPQSVNNLLSHFFIDVESIDYFIFHQANKFMNEKIRKKLILPEEKVPYSLKDFGNTSCATIPLTMVTQLRDKLTKQKLSHVACGFGVGLSWGSCYFKTDKIACPDIIEY
jgi:3-oxoacyl-[acyl-carrier-protein] synthase-3